MKAVFWIDEDRRDPPLAIVLCPRGGELTERALRSFQRAGVETVVSLLEAEELRWMGLKEEGETAEALGLGFLWHPLPDHRLPVDEAAFRAFVRGLAKRLNAGERIGIHCFGCIGRSTVTAACAMIELGWEAEAALEAIGVARGCPVPDTEEQREWILAYEARM